MKIFVFITASIIACSQLSAQNVVSKKKEKSNPVVIYPTPKGIAKKLPKSTAAYNAASTALTVKFPSTNDGKVEIYRNGTKVVSTVAPAGATLNYVLRNYGKGNYTIIVSQGNTVVYSNNVTVK